MDLNDEWESFLNSSEPSIELIQKIEPIQNLDQPISTNIYISTKTIIAYLSSTIDLKEIFWNLPIISYNIMETGILKKEMKFNSTQREEVELIEQYLEKYEYKHVTIIQHIENSNAGRIQYKDIRKVSIGISKRDLLAYRIKKKSAFYNCVVLIMRILIQDTYKEFHVKVFNTGRLEIPGIQNNEQIYTIIDLLVSYINKIITSPIYYKEGSEEIVLINSNFNCGYYINRENLYNILRHTYKISAIYDSCSYPGIQCKIYYEDNELLLIPKNNKNVVSFMIFRTGSILIVGKCNEIILNKIYDYISSIMKNEYTKVVDLNSVHVKKEFQPKKFRKYISLSLAVN
jgi:hypothetical protein